MDIDLSDVIAECSKSTVLITVTRTTVDFEDVVIESPEPIEAMIQPANKEQLKAQSIDYSLEYLMVHSDSIMLAGQYIEHRGAKFKIISNIDYQDYGYTEAIAEEVKGSIT